MRNVFAILISTVLWAASCSSPRTVADELADASAAISGADYSRAGAICQKILNNYPMEKIPAPDLCTMAVILFKASEHADAEENAASAVRCYHYVTKEKPDSAAKCWGEMPSEDFQYVFLLNNLNTSLTAASDPTSIPEE
ncbi:MAG: hypothetical protein K2L90_06360 [Muribaculaceae bacterium]|nr:hypothetical protein [Muribaculaceae bacterium]